MDKLHWKHAHNGEVPHDAIRADGHCAVIRAQHEGHWCPGKAVHGHPHAYIPFGGKEVAKGDYEVLTMAGGHSFDDTLKWKRASSGRLADRAVVAGSDIDGEKLFIAKANINGEVCVGKVKPSHSCAYMPWGGKENRVNEYQVLCVKK